MEEKEYNNAETDLSELGQMDRGRWTGGDGQGEMDRGPDTLKLLKRAKALKTHL